MVRAILSDVPELEQVYLLPAGGCNLACRHCWVSAPASDRGFEPREKTDNELTVAEIEDIASQARSMGAEAVKLTGTEPMLRSDFAEIYLALSERALGITIETNGTLRPPGVKEVFESRPPRQVSVSLDSSDPYKHDDFRGFAGSFDRAVAFIEILVSLQINTQIIVSLSRFDMEEVKSMARLADELGVSSLKLNPVVPLGRGERMELTAYDAQERIEFTGKAFEIFGPAVNIAIPPAFKPLNRLPTTSSCHVLNLIGVLSDGNTSFCGIGLSRPDLVFGDLRRQSLEDIWQNSEVLGKIRRAVPVGLKGVCRNCMHRRQCLGYCVMENYVHGGSFDSPHPLCQTAFEMGIFPESRRTHG